MVVPSRRAPGIGVGRGLGVERGGEAQADAVLVGVQLAGNGGELPLADAVGNVADALEGAVADAVGLPTLEAADVELAVFGVEAGAMIPEANLSGNLNDPPCSFPSTISGSIRCDEDAP